MQNIMSKLENQLFLNTSSKQLETEILKNNIYNSLKRTEIFRHECSKICARSVCLKLQKTDERNQRSLK